MACLAFGLTSTAHGGTANDYYDELPPAPVHLRAGQIDRIAFAGMTATITVVDEPGNTVASEPSAAAYTVLVTASYGAATDVAFAYQ